MTSDVTGEANTVASTTERAKPELLTIGNRQIISTGRWNNGLIADYLMLHGSSKWLTVGEIAKVAWGQNTISTKKRARRCLSHLWHYLLVERGQLLVIEYSPDGHHQAQALKIYDPQSVSDRQVIEIRLERMSKTKELTEDRYQRACSLLAPSAN